MKVRPEAHDGKWNGPRTTKEGLYWMSPSGPPATTSIWAAFAGRADRRPSTVESAKSLENMASVFEERRRGLIEIERKECLMRHQWALRWTLYLKTIGLSALQSRGGSRDRMRPCKTIRFGARCLAILFQGGVLACMPIKRSATVWSSSGYPIMSGGTVPCTLCLPARLQGPDLATLMGVH